MRAAQSRNGLKATTAQVRKHYKDLGYEVKINRDGYVGFRYPARDAIWKDGRYVSEYRIDDRGNVVLT